MQKSFHRNLLIAKQVYIENKEEIDWRTQNGTYSFVHYVSKKSKRDNFEGYFQMRIFKGFSKQIQEINTTFCSKKSEF